MALNKRTYVDQTTIITADNLNDIQDEIIANGLNVDKHSGVFADEYDSASTYAIGDYCTHDNLLYKCNTAITVTEDWNAAHWTEVTVGDELAQADWDEADATKADYIKNKPTIPAAQIQSDWSQSDNTQVDFIKNKPSIPVIDATLANQGQAADAKATGDKITEAEQIMSYLETGNTASRNYSAGEYVNWKGVLYTVNTGGISSGASFVAGSGGNLSAVGDEGGLNDLKNTITLQLIGRVGTVADLGTAITTFLSSAPEGTVRNCYFGVNVTHDTDVFEWLDYVGYVSKYTNSIICGFFENSNGNCLTIATVNGGISWNYSLIANKAEISQLSSKVDNLLQIASFSLYNGDGIAAGAIATYTFTPNTIPSGYEIIALLSFSNSNGSFIGSAKTITTTSITVNAVNCSGTTAAPELMTISFLCKKS